MLLYSESHDAASRCRAANLGKQDPMTWELGKSVIDMCALMSLTTTLVFDGTDDRQRA